MKSSMEILEEMQQQEALSPDEFMRDLQQLPMVEMPAPLDGSGMEAVRLALRQPKKLSISEGLAFLGFRRTAAITRTESIWRARRGNAVFRRQGIAGADLPYPPVEWDYRQALMRYNAITTPDQREEPDPMLGVQARQKKADVRAQRVLALYPEYQHRGRHAAALIAKRLGERDFYVRRILRENVHDRKN